jgi:cell surface protein SprA
MIKGSYTSSVSSDISLGRMQIPQGSVIVTAGGAPLTEGADYTVDYMMGRVKILREDILNSGTPIDISFESADMFGVSNKNLYATRLDYWINNNFTLGATAMKIAERPWQQNAQFGSEPINNSIYGVDANYYSELPGLTRFLDNLPIISTKEKSSITLSGEYAKLVPGHPKIVSGAGGEGASALDNFEGAKIEYSIMDRFSSWHLASTPTGESDIIAAGNSNDLDYGKQRGLINWRTVDPTFYNSGGINITFGHYDRPVKIKEIWPNRDLGLNAVWDIHRTFDLSFYPSERGPYNFETENLNADGNFVNPSQNWGGVMRYLPVTDFETNNFEMIEFWIMDPFLDDDQISGELVINLGDISEDILKDGNTQFENGLPSITEISPPLETSAWGVTPAIPPVSVAFDTDPESRDMQDVGLDGLNDSVEAIFFSEFVTAIQANTTLSDSIKTRLINDPSSDNFEFFRSTRHESNNSNLMERYKYFNGIENNSPSPTGSDSSFIQSPTTEDLNRNNSLDDAENYYEYRININNTDLDSNNVGNNYLVSSTDTIITDPNNPQETKRVTWYQFQVPVKEFNRRVGNIDGFRSIRYMRMYMKGFEKPVHIRFGSLALVRNQWRKYGKSLFEGEDLVGIHTDNNDGQNFNVSSVSLFEHGSKSPVNYVKPPGVIQERQLSQFNGLQRQDERAMSMSVCNLIDGDARAVFKNMTWDVRNYKRIKTYVHAENPDEELHNLEDQDLVFFMRFGMDNTFNYYEYQMPLRLTPYGTYQDGNSAHSREVWDSIDVQLRKFVNLKTQRNEDNFNANFIYTKVDTIIDGVERWVSIKGNPDLSRIKSFLIGVRNPGQGSPLNPKQDDDGSDKCVELWVNELKLVGFDEEGGAAALAMMEIQLADIGDIVLSGQMHEQGFGAIDATIMDRYLDDYYTYTASAQINLHKFLPAWVNFNIPFYASNTKTVSTPRYDPFQGDTRLKDKLNAMRDQGESLSKITATRDSASTVETNKSYNFTNIKKNKGKNATKPHIYDISNVSLTYRHVENNKSNPFVARNSRTTEQGIISYNYGHSPKNYKPFYKLIGRNKLLKPIKQFNYTLGFNTIAMTSNMNRQIGEVRLRSFGDEVQLPSYQNKRFDWNRTYALKHKPAKSIDLSFNAATTSFLNEDRDSTTRKGIRRSIIDSLQHNWENDNTIGVITAYNQNTSASYKLPFKHLPYLSWMNVTAKHTTKYNWNGSNLILPALGNTISNGQNISFNMNIKSRTLYREIKALNKDINKLFETDDKKKKDKDNKTKGKKDKKKPKRKGQSTASKMFKKGITGIKTTSIGYTESKTTIVPGFQPDPLFIGQSGINPYTGDPGLGFTFGLQPFFNQDATSSEWLDNLSNPDKEVFNQIDSTSILQEVIWTEGQNINAKFGVEWIKSLRVDLNWKRDYTSAASGYYTNSIGAFTPENENTYFQLLNQRTQGNFKFTYVSAPSSFTGNNLRNDSTIFKNFLDKRIDASEMMAINQLSHEVDSGYTYGNGQISQQVLIPAFIAAYTDRDVVEDDIFFTDPSYFKQIVPLPNWRITYNGLAKLKPLKKFFSNIKVSHNYTSTYAFNSFQSDPGFDEKVELSFQESGLDTNGNFYQEDLISQVTITEKFAPLIKFDVTMKNNFSYKIEFSRSRTANLSFATLNVNEQKSKEVRFGTGYKIPAGLWIKFGSVDYRTVKPINVEVSYGIKDNITTLYGIINENRTHTGGTKKTSTTVSADYDPNVHMNLKFMFDYSKVVPYTSNNYPVTNLQVYILLTYRL